MAGLSGFVIFLLFTYFGEAGRGTIAGAFFGAFAVTIRICWPLRKEYWYWIALLVLITVHLIGIMIFTWLNAAAWNGLVVMPFMAADILIILSLIYWLYGSIYGYPSKIFDDSELDYRE